MERELTKFAKEQTNRADPWTNGTNANPDCYFNQISSDLNATKCLKLTGQSSKWETSSQRF